MGINCLKFTGERVMLNIIELPLDEVATEYYMDSSDI